MINKISRPTCPYSKLWADYWLQNPSEHRSVGSAAAAEPGPEPKKQEITPEMFSALQDSIEKLEANNKALLQEKREQEKAAQKAIEDAAKKSGDVEALEKSWGEKLAAATAERDGKLSAYEQMVNRMTVGSEAQRLAAAIALPGSADVLLPHIERRLSVEVKDGQPIVRVLDKDGKPSALSLADLQKEIESTPAFAPITVGSKASGAGGVGGKGSTGSKTMKRGDFDQLDPAAKMAHVKDGGNVID